MKKSTKLAMFTSVCFIIGAILLGDSIDKMDYLHKVGFMSMALAYGGIAIFATNHLEINVSD